MNITIWGCRGSIPAPGSDSIRYGGDTTCIEVRSDAGEIIIIDAGSGIRKLGQKLIKDDSITNINLLLTHAHWDHLIGYPFFQPVYYSKYTISLCGGASALNYLMHEMDPPYFPVKFSELKAKFETNCCCFSGCEKRLVKGIECDSIALNHPNGGWGFKLTNITGSFVFLTDNEIRFSHKGGASREEFVAFCKNADLLLHDAQYLEEEYVKTRGWGHSTYQDAIDLAIDSGVRRLGLIHHDPDRTDDALDRQVEWCIKYIQEKGSSLECFACSTGMTLIV